MTKMIFLTKFPQHLVIFKNESTARLQILYMMKITIFKPNAEILLQSVISVENNRTF